MVALLADDPFDYASVTADSIAADAAAVLDGAEAILSDIVGTSAPTFDSVVRQLDRAWSMTVECEGRTSLLAYVHPDEAVRDSAALAEEQIEGWRRGIAFRDALQATFQRYVDTPEAATLSPGAKRRLVDVWQRDFRRAGHHLPADQRAIVAGLRQRVTELEFAFHRNVTATQDGIEVDRAGLEGLPDDYVDGLTPGSRPGTWWVGLEYPQLEPFLELAHDRSLREALFRKWWGRAPENGAVVDEILALRREIASRLGYESYADFVTEIRMTGTAARVNSFLEQYASRLLTAQDRDLVAMRRLLAADGHPGVIAAWDWRYYAERQRRDGFDVDQTWIAEHLPLDRVLSELFALCAEVFDVSFRVVAGVPVWDESVIVASITADGAADPSGLVYFDLAPRDGKYTHGFTGPISLPRYQDDGSIARPRTMVVLNLTSPISGQPALLRHSEMVTLFHEFGHVLHMTVGDAKFGRLASSEVELDFVEAPSQIMENWAWNREVIARVARHHRSGAPLDDGTVDRLIASRSLNSGLQRSQRLFQAAFDLAVHAAHASPDVDAVLRETFALTRFAPYPAGTCLATSFQHIFGGGYEAGYYGYLWAEVIGADLAGRFQHEGWRSPKVGAAYRNLVLAPNGSRPADEIVREFLGREPTLDAWEASLTGSSERTISTA